VATLSWGKLRVSLLLQPGSASSACTANQVSYAKLVMFFSYAVGSPTTITLPSSWHVVSTVHVIQNEHTLLVPMSKGIFAVWPRFVRAT
jgi:hypothetical protein